MLSLSFSITNSFVLSCISSNEIQANLAWLKNASDTSTQMTLCGRLDSDILNLPETSTPARAEDFRNTDIQLS